ncbi:molybdenum cofactor guanylyltransferase [Reinekea marina]|uniref:Molybdenum cofactor guanylyltransferase n=2 Tax=Reinekea marina TaxID=1310421 RepID=A0ABV7WV62_9GAMM
MTRAVLVLSGGQSRRMKQDKSQLIYKGQTLLNWQVDRFKEAGYRVICQLKDRYPGYLGPLAGIDAALNQHQAILHWVVTPVDMPKLPIELVAQLFHEGQRQKVPVAFDHAPLPLYLQNTAKVRDILTEWLQSKNGKRSVYALIEELGGHWMPATHAKQELNNINTPEEWQKVIAVE